MLKRIISISLLLIIAFVMAAPILHIDCDMPCCEAKNESCCVEEADIDYKKSCTMSKTECDHSQFIPIVSAPKSNLKSVNVDMANFTYKIKIDAPKCQLSKKTVYLDRSSDSQAKFLIPLRL